MKIITFATLKGGVGKTMLCFNMGGLLSIHKKKVLLIDSDLQGNLTNNIGIDRTRNTLLTMYDIYNTEKKAPPPDKLVVRTPNHALPNLDIIAGSLFLHKSELRLSGVTGREMVLRAYIDEYRSFFQKYDYILIDTNPTMSIINQNAFVISDSIILVADVSMNAIEGAQLFIALWDESRKRLRLPGNIKGFVINDFDSRTRLSHDFLEYIKTAEDLEDIRAICFRTIIPRSVRITESELAALPISALDRSSKAAQAIEGLASEMKKRGVI
jgi:chromosome partitioning protein